MKRIWKITLYISLGLSSFLFFFYLTFPYEILKETIVLNASEASGLNISIHKIRPGFLMGIKGSSVQIGTSSGNKIRLRQADVNLSFLSFFVGEARFHIELEDEQQGTFDLNIGFSLTDLIKGQSPLWPSSVVLDAREFLFGDIVDFLLKQQSESPEANPLLQPLLESIDLDGRMNANINLSINSADLNNSSGSAEVRLTNLIIRSRNSNLPIPDQMFSKAIIMAKLNKGVLSVDQSSGFVSQDLSVGIGGKIIQKPQLAKSDLDFQVPVKLGPPLQEQFGIILDTMAQRQTKGAVEISISGALVPGPHISFL
ncbi:MAG: type II secretion system protein GspN [Deltaproteobacteria bacterium]|nr:type II secretion system protein GspN [Deltaproteobacteria bacterium]